MFFKRHQSRKWYLGNATNKITGLANNPTHLELIHLEVELLRAHKVLGGDGLVLVVLQLVELHLQLLDEMTSLFSVLSCLTSMENHLCDLDLLLAVGLLHGGPLGLARSPRSGVRRHGNHVVVLVTLDLEICNERVGSIYLNWQM